MRGVIFQPAANLHGVGRLQIDHRAPLVRESHTEAGGNNRPPGIGSSVSSRSWKLRVDGGCVLQVIVQGLIYLFPGQRLHTCSNVAPELEENGVLEGDVLRHGDLDFANPPEIPLGSHSFEQAAARSGIVGCHHGLGRLSRIESHCTSRIVDGEVPIGQVGAVLGLGNGIHFDDWLVGRAQVQFAENLAVSRIDPVARDCWGVQRVIARIGQGFASDSGRILIPGFFLAEVVGVAIQPATRGKVGLDLDEGVRNLYRCRVGGQCSTCVRGNKTVQNRLVPLGQRSFEPDITGISGRVDAIQGSDDGAGSDLQGQAIGCHDVIKKIILNRVRVFLVGH